MELVVFLGAMLVYTRLRRKELFALRGGIRGLTIYLPPTQGDYEQFMKSCEKPEENTKAYGKRNKSFKQKQERVSYPLRTA